MAMAIVQSIALLAPATRSPTLRFSEALAVERWVAAAAPHLRITACGALAAITSLFLCTAAALSPTPTRRLSD